MFFLNIHLILYCLLKKLRPTLLHFSILFPINYKGLILNHFFFAKLKSDNSLYFHRSKVLISKYLKYIHLLFNLNVKAYLHFSIKFLLVNLILKTHFTLIYYSQITVKAK
jgi:hypothetical protein